MKLFKCTNCGQLLYFENHTCESCKSPLGFIPESLNLSTLVQGENVTYTLHSKEKPTVFGKLFKKNDQPTFKYCNNYQFDVCNWLVPANSEKSYCRACELNQTIPDLTEPENVRKWGLIEQAKHRLVYSLLELKLPLASKLEELETGLGFDFLTDAGMTEKVLTGHENGLITLNINEADDDKRELLRKEMNEPYRTLLGHFRHEVGHYYWDQLIDNSPFLAEYREIFGDETEDYGAALQRHYNEGPPADWKKNFISEYATTHSWEDWAETWAHYLHIMDTLETADTFGISVAPRIADKSDHVTASIRRNPYQEQDFKKLIDLWLPLTFAVNSLNRSMGNHDLYPFVIPPAVVAKLTFIHKVCFQSRVE